MQAGDGPGGLSGGRRAIEFRRALSWKALLREDELLTALSSVLEPPETIIGAGNELREDDAFGPEVVRLLSESPLPDGVSVLAGGVAPENLAERVARESPRTVLIVDAAEFGGEVGELRLIDPRDLAWGPAGTHAPSLELLAAYIEERCGAEVAILAAQPGGLTLGRPISARMRAAARGAASALRRALGAEGGEDPARENRGGG